MNYAEFISGVIGYYGAYKVKAVERATVAYIKNRFREDELEGVFSELIIKYSNTYKTPPDPSKFEEMFGNDVETRALNAWNMVQNIGSMETVLFEDPVVSAVILNGWSGWREFVNHRESENYWCRKQFIEIYKALYPQRKNIKNQKLLGYRDQLNKNNKFFGQYGVRLVGNKENCLKILSEVDDNFGQIEHCVQKVINKI